MKISGLSGNEIYCLSLKGFAPGEITVGNSVRSLGFGGAMASGFQSLAGGEIQNITQLISEGRHAAIGRMEEEARRHGASGLTGVATELKTLAGYSEFLSQGTGVHAAGERPFFTTSASGIELYCHLDAGYQPIKFVMGNVAYALGVGRGLMGGLRTMAQGEVPEFSQMYNNLRHVALRRMQEEAAACGANAVVDVSLEMLPFGVGTLELLLTGTASRHARFGEGKVAPEQVVTSELSGAEIWSLAKLGYVPVQLVMATSVYSLGVAAGIGTMFRSFSKGELTEVTQLVYKARENCLELLRSEATRLGAERVVGNRLVIRELSQGLIEVVALGTAIRPMEGVSPESPSLIPQALIVDQDSVSLESRGGELVAGRGAPRAQGQATGCLVGLAVFVMMAVGMLTAILSHRQ